MTANQEIRQALKTSHVFQWELAQAMDYSATHFTVLMRKEFSPKRKAACLDAIKRIAEVKEHEETA